MKQFLLYAVVALSLLLSRQTAIHALNRINLLFSDSTNFDHNSNKQLKNLSILFFQRFFSSVASRTRSLRLCSLNLELRDYSFWRQSCRNNVLRSSTAESTTMHGLCDHLETWSQESCKYINKYELKFPLYKLNATWSPESLLTFISLALSSQENTHRTLNFYLRQDWKKNQLSTQYLPVARLLIGCFRTFHILLLLFLSSRDPGFGRLHSISAGNKKWVLCHE